MTIVVQLSDAQQELQARARQFADEHIRPIAGDRDRIQNPLETFPWDVWRAASKEGFRTLAMPLEHGGSGMDVLTHCVVLEELAAADAAFGGAFHQVWKLQRLLLANDYLRRNVLPRFLKDDDYQLCIGITEPGFGTDNLLPYDEPEGGMQTSAVRDASGNWTINGKKHFIFVGGQAKGVFVLCRTDPTRGVGDGVTMFFLESHTPGFSYGRTHDKLGWRLTPNAELDFDEVSIPDVQRVSGVNEGLAFAGAFGKPHAPTTAAFSVGTARAAFELTLDWCKNRVQGGQPIIRHQAVSMKLADMWSDIEMARTAVWKAAWSAEHDPNHDVKLGILAQHYASEMVVRVCYKAMELWGGRGFMREYPIEKLMRDALANYHLDGVNDINRLRIGRSLAGDTGGYIG